MNLGCALEVELTGLPDGMKEGNKGNKKSWRMLKVWAVSVSQGPVWKFLMRNTMSTKQGPCTQEPELLLGSYPPQGQLHSRDRPWLRELTEGLFQAGMLVLGLSSNGAQELRANLPIMH